MGRGRDFPGRDRFLRPAAEPGQAVRGAARRARQPALQKLADRLSRARFVLQPAGAGLYRVELRLGFPRQTTQEEETMANLKGLGICGSLRKASFNMAGLAPPPGLLPARVSIWLTDIAHI